MSVIKNRTFSFRICVLVNRVPLVCVCVYVHVFVQMHLFHNFYCLMFL